MGPCPRCPLAFDASGPPPEAGAWGALRGAGIPPGSGRLRGGHSVRLSAQLPSLRRTNVAVTPLCRETLSTEQFPPRIRPGPSGTRPSTQLAEGTTEAGLSLFQPLVRSPSPPPLSQRPLSASWEQRMATESKNKVLYCPWSWLGGRAADPRATQVGLPWPRL